MRDLALDARPRRTRWTKEEHVQQVRTGAAKRQPPASADTSRRQFLRGLVRPDAEQDPAVETPLLTAFATVPAPGFWADSRLRLVRRATMGMNATDASDAKRMGYQQWLNMQVYHTE